LACGTPVLVSSEVAAAFPTIDTACVFAVDLAVAEPAQALRERLRVLSEQRGDLDAARSAAASLAQQWSWDVCVDRYRGVYGSLTRTTVQ
jgi:glycosyltransferase involved in cell wall biosynthesis